MLITGVSSSPGYKMAVSLANRYEVVDTYNEHPISMPGATTVKAGLTRGFYGFVCLLWPIPEGYHYR